VEQAGYGLVPPQVGKHAELGVDGMTCASCSAAVERALKKLDGVTEASVNLATNRATFVYDPSKVKLAQVREAITKAGYTPLDLESEDTHDVDRERRERALLVMRIRLIVAAVFAAPILYLAMAQSLPARGVPLPTFMNPHTFPLVFALVQLLLTIPVLIAGGKFFRVGIKTLFKGAPNMDTLVAIGTGSAFLYGVYATVLIYLGDFGFAQHLYFESAAVVITLVMLGKYLEAASKSKTSEAIQKLLALKPKTAIILKNDAELEVSLDEVAVGDLVLVRPGSAIPVDGVVEDGASSVDESMHTAARRRRDAKRPLRSSRT